MPDKIPIENLLIDSGYLTRSQLDRAMRLKQGRLECSIEEILTEFGYVTEAALLTCAAARDHMEVAPFGPLKADRKSAAVIEPSFAVRNRILPMSFEEECLIVAAAYPVSPDVLDEVETLSGMKVRAVLAPEKELKQALKRPMVPHRSTYTERIHMFQWRGPVWELARLRKPLFQSWPSWNGWKALLWYAWSIRS